MHKNAAIDYLQGHVKASLEVHYLKFKTTSTYDKQYKQMPSMARPKAVERLELNEKNKLKAQHHYNVQIERKGWSTQDRQKEIMKRLAEVKKKDVLKA